MGQPAYKTVLKIGGTSTKFVGETATSIGGNKFQIKDISKQILDRNVAPVVKVDNKFVTPSDYTVDYLFGIITFNTEQKGVVTINGNFIPTISIAGANQYSVDITGDILENTNFEDVIKNGGYKTKQYGMLDIAVSVSRFDDTKKTFKTKLQDREVVLLEIKPNDVETIRGWFVVEKAGSQGENNALEAESLSFQLDGNNTSAFSWR